jgi:hypothetical protein
MLFNTVPAFRRRYHLPQGNPSSLSNKMKGLLE